MGQHLMIALLVGAVACSSDGEPPQRADVTSSSEAATSASTAADVVLDDVRYVCGPSDALVIRFRLSASTALSGAAHLLVLGEVYGTADVEVGTTPADYFMDINLSQAAFDEGQGEVRITSDSGQVVAIEPVTLRLPAGVECG
jgi:hypothetical protein